MRITEHFIKRFEILIGEQKAREEMKLIKDFILPGQYCIHWNRGIEVNDLLLFSERCSKFEGRVLGVETHINSDYSFYCFTWENYSTSYYFEWIIQAIDNLKELKVKDCVIPSVSFLPKVLDEYLYL